MSVTWISGNSGSGKTTLAKALARPKDVLLDGDAMRTCWTIGLSAEDRIEHNLRIARLAKTLSEQGLEVIVATICPYRTLREQVTAICSPRWIYLSGGQAPSAEYPYEPEEPQKF